MNSNRQTPDTDNKHRRSLGGEECIVDEKQRLKFCPGYGLGAFWMRKILTFYDYQKSRMLSALVLSQVRGTRCVTTRTDEYMGPPTTKLKSSQRKDIKYHNIPDVLDIPTYNIIQHFPSTCKLLTSILRSSQTSSNPDNQTRILVHCSAGVSRSSTLVLAFLMVATHCDFVSALARLKAKKPDIDPNEGFVKQLELWKIMGYRVDKENSEYKRWAMELVAEGVKNGGIPSNLAQELDIHPDPEQPRQTSNTKQTTVKLPHIRCRRCRTIVAIADQCLKHEQGQGSSSFAYHKRNGLVLQATTATLLLSSSSCQSYFIEPPSYVVDGDELEGKLDCQKCGAVVGKWSWSGLQCSCGAWVSPAFMVHKKGVDEIVPVGFQQDILTDEAPTDIR